MEKTVAMTWEKDTEDILILTSLSLSLSLSLSFSGAPTRSSVYRTKAVGAERRAGEKDAGDMSSA